MTDKSERIIPLCFSHMDSMCRNHPKWAAVACWQITGIFHDPVCEDCKQKLAKEE